VLATGSKQVHDQLETSSSKEMYPYISKWRFGIVGSVVGQINEVTLRAKLGAVSTGMGDRRPIGGPLPVGKFISV